MTDFVHPPTFFTKGKPMSTSSGYITTLISSVDSAVTRILNDIAAMKAQIVNLQATVDAGGASTADIAALAALQAMVDQLEKAMSVETLEDDQLTWDIIPEGADELRTLQCEIKRLMVSHAALQAACEEAESFLKTTVAYGAARLDKCRVRKALRAAIAGAKEVSR